MTQITLAEQHDLVLGILGYLRQRSNELSWKHRIPKHMQRDLFIELIMTALEMAPSYVPIKGGFVSFIYRALNNTARAFAAEKVFSLTYAPDTLKSYARVKWAVAELGRRGIEPTVENVSALAEQTSSMAKFFSDPQNTPHQATPLSTPVGGRSGDEETEELGKTLRSSSESPEEHLLRIEVYEWVVKSQHFLTSDELRALLAYCLLDFSYAEIGRRLGVSRQQGENLVLTAGDKIRANIFGGPVVKRRASGNQKNKRVRLKRIAAE